jgi:hypothetical protein
MRKPMIARTLRVDAGTVVGKFIVGLIAVAVQRYGRVHDDSGFRWDTGG